MRVIARWWLRRAVVVYNRRGRYNRRRREGTDWGRVYNLALLMRGLEAGAEGAMVGGGGEAAEGGERGRGREGRRRKVMAFAIARG